MKIAMFGNKSLQFRMVFTEEILKTISEYGEISPMIKKDSLEKNKNFLHDCEIGFSTWGMPELNEKEIRYYLPNMKVLFYAAGTVQYFARPFLNCGIKVISAFAANSVPVSEFTYAQILLAAKGYFRAMKMYKLIPPGALLFANTSPGNYNIKIGLIGLGAIGSSVAEKLKSTDAEVYAYDPFASEEKAASLNVKLKDLQYIFSHCDIISNHLADKQKLNNILNKNLFKLMKKHSVFINTGRGAQVNEKDLALSLLAHPSRTALIDVLKRDYCPYVSPLFWCNNAIITPHIAGSSGREPQRMAQYMIEELRRYVKNQDFLYEITPSMLDHMA